MLQYIMARFAERSTIAGVLLAVEQILHLDTTHLTNINDQAAGLIAALILFLMKEHPPVTAPVTAP